MACTPVECPHTYKFIAISREDAVRRYRASRESVVRYGYASAAKFDALITALVADPREACLGENRDQAPSRLAAFVNEAQEVADTALECYAEAGMDAYYTSAHNGASHGASLSLAYGAACPTTKEN